MEMYKLFGIPRQLSAAVFSSLFTGALQVVPFLPELKITCRRICPKTFSKTRLQVMKEGRRYCALWNQEGRLGKGGLRRW
jgi:hypothetical protein